VTECRTMRPKTSCFMVFSHSTYFIDIGNKTFDISSLQFYKIFFCSSIRVHVTESIYTNCKGICFASRYPLHNAVGVLSFLFKVARSFAYLLIKVPLNFAWSNLKTFGST